MTKINAKSTFAAAAFGAAALFSMVSFGGNAEAASNVLSCEGPSASKVKSCCETLVKQNGRPFWMIQAGTNCHAAVGCHHKFAGLNHCYMTILAAIDESSDGKRSRSRSHK